MVPTDNGKIVGHVSVFTSLSFAFPTSWSLFTVQPFYTGKLTVTVQYAFFSFMGNSFHISWGLGRGEGQRYVNVLFTYSFKKKASRKTTTKPIHILLQIHICTHTQKVLPATWMHACTHAYTHTQFHTSCPELWHAESVELPGSWSLVRLVVMVAESSQTRIWEVEGQHLLTCQWLWSWTVAVESDCCCGVGLLLWSQIVAVELDWWNWIVAVEWDCCCGVGLLKHRPCHLLDKWRLGQRMYRRLHLLLPPASFLSGSGGWWHSLIDRKFGFIDS